jgi:Zn2+/Cd2+-exporting ATPase
LISPCFGKGRHRHCDGCGADTATAFETADVAIMDDDPRKIADFIGLSRHCASILKQNISLALDIKVVFLSLALSGHATLWMAVCADMGGSLLVVFNGLRLLRYFPRAGYLPDTTNLS